MKLKLLTPIFAIGLASSAHAAVVFFDDFETGSNDATATSITGSYSQTPDVDAAGSDGNTDGSANTTLYTRANQGFGGSRNGLVDESHGDFTDPVGSQGYAFRYTNSGLTTNEGVIGAFAAGTYTVTFDLYLDGHNGGSAYNVGLVTFDTTTPLARNDVRANTNATSLLGSTSGTFDFVGEGVTVTTLSFQYISDGTEGVIGDDLAVRVFGSTSHAIIDNLEVDYVPEPSAALLGGIGALMLLRRRRG